ncbi:hypothetical protein [Mesorhizobium sp. M4B.F.Ca.ET.049.02.1.2]|uniref:hypothetical protein n=1 Tax=Mesorhizobium sp. M4B.F.Ca.ET.049.02.1.2 TaxID=2496752 RepID=UPI000FC9EAED|nr:hypothetical protein [Mesorhizobium sp. M4B.F.Ca.ET.049.02.1.2]RUW68747.1 hypothetical protein EOA31_25060 [Mesorhizobium sp. M4B.F.Ca.ET.049.02.1.2]
MFSIDIKPNSVSAINDYDWSMISWLLQVIVNDAVDNREADLNRGARIEDISAPGKSVRTIRAEFVDVYGSAITVFAAFDDGAENGSVVIFHATDDPDIVIPHLDLHEPAYQG